MANTSTQVQFTVRIFEQFSEQEKLKVLQCIEEIIKSKSRQANIVIHGGELNEVDFREEGYSSFDTTSITQTKLNTTI